MRLLFVQSMRAWCWVIPGPRIHWAGLLPAEGAFALTLGLGQQRQAPGPASLEGLALTWFINITWNCSCTAGENDPIVGCAGLAFINFGFHREQSWVLARPPEGYDLIGTG